METVHQNSSKGFPSDLVKAPLHSEETQYYRKGKLLAYAFKENKTKKTAFGLNTGCHTENTPTVVKHSKETVTPALLQTFDKRGVTWMSNIKRDDMWLQFIQQRGTGENFSDCCGYDTAELLYCALWQHSCKLSIGKGTSHY
jgi:hypothetical protein